MSIYDKASLVLIPSGTKTSKVYSQVPVNGDGDFTFSRSTAATRVNADGNIEKETQNLLLQSNSFDTNWYNTSTTETGGQSGYDGSSDAWLLSKTGTSGRIVQTISNTGVQTFSVYAKAGSLNWMRLITIRTAGNSPRADFDLSGSGAVGVTSNTIDATIESIGGGWFRCSLVANVALTEARIYPADANNDVSGTSGNILIQDAQVEQGLVARDVITTTTAAVEGGITDNVPRLDYTDSSCPALLLEPQRTNLLPNSEYIGSSDWDKNGFGTGVAPVLTFGEESPEGLNNAYEITFNTGAGTSSGNQSNISEGIGGQAAGDYTLSFWAKVSSGTDKIIARGAGGYLYTTCNLTTEWQRFEITENLATAGTLYVDIGLRRGLANEPLNSSVTCQIYGIQMEAGSYATSYIPTYGTSVTRNEDTYKKLGFGNTSTEGTFYAEFEVKKIESANGQYMYGLSVGTTDLGNFYAAASGALSIITNGANIQGLNNGYADSLFSYTPSIGDTAKIAIRYDGSNVVAFVNGVKQTTKTDNASGVKNSIRVNHGEKSSHATKQLLFIPTALTDQEAIDLTTI